MQLHVSAASEQTRYSRSLRPQRSTHRTVGSWLLLLPLFNNIEPLAVAVRPLGVGNLAAAPATHKKTDR